MGKIRLEKNRRNIIILVFIIQLIITLSYGIHRFPDTQSYIDSANFFIEGGELPELFVFRLLRPLPLLLADALSFINGIEFGFLLQNLIFLALSTYLFYKVMSRIYNRKGQEDIAFFSTLIFISALPILEFGLAILTDMGTWFFFLWSLYLFLLSIEKGIDYKYTALGGLVAGLGVLMKQNAAASALFFGLFLLLLPKISFSEKTKKGIVLVFMFLIPNIIASGWLYLTMGFTHLDQLGYVTTPTEIYYTPAMFIVSFLQAFTLLVPFFLLGVYYVIREKRYENLKFNGILLVSTLVPILAFPAFTDRYTFLIFPVVIPLSIIGLKRFRELLKRSFTVEEHWILVAFVIIFFLCNNLVYYHIRVFDYCCLKQCLFDRTCLNLCRLTLPCPL